VSYHLVRPQNLPERRNVFREMFSVITEAQSPLASRSMAVVILNKFFVLYWNHFVKLTGLLHCIKVIFVSHKHFVCLNTDIHMARVDKQNYFHKSSLHDKLHHKSFFMLISCHLFSWHIIFIFSAS